MKNQIIDATNEKDFDLYFDNFNQFFGIIISSIFNIRRDYWATDEMLHSDIVSNTMRIREIIVKKSSLI